MKLPIFYTSLKRNAVICGITRGVKLAGVVTGAIFLAACSSTQPDTSENFAIDPQCKHEAFEMQASAQKTGIQAQYLTSANGLLSCIQHLPVRGVDSDLQQESMQLMALATLNYLKGGDAKQAKVTLSRLSKQYPNQDLYLQDYTSFVDSLTALIDGHKLSSQELAALNISRQLRGEVERQQYWLSH